MKKRFSVFQFVIALIIGCYLCLQIIHHWGWGVCKVVGGSMEPTFHDGDKLFYACYPLLFREPKKGEVVILKDPADIWVIKRVALIPGEWDNVTPGTPHILRPGEYVVLGDNTNNSIDSRFYGTVIKEQIKGVVR